MATNIVSILIDDLGVRDLACFGSTFYETPRLDALAKQGMRFTNAYAACPVCSPTRAAMMSGKYPARVGVTDWIGGAATGKLTAVPYLHYLSLEEVSIAKALREGGYQTWHVGKWHLGDEPFYPEHHGFDVNIAGCHMGHPNNGYWSPYKIPTLTDGPQGEYLTDRITNEAIALLKKRDRSRPFFLNLCHYAVHTPIQAPPELVEKYRAKAKALRLDTVETIVDGEPLPFLPRQPGGNPGRVRRRMIQSDPAYAAMIENLDTNIGRLLDALEAEGLAKDTLVTFTSDNGGLSTAQGAPTCNLPWSEGKGWNAEGGTRVCQIARYPRKIAANSTCHTPVTTTDFYPTFLQTAGLPLRPQQHIDGLSMTPLFEKSTATLPRKAIFWHYPHYSGQGGTPAASLVTADGRWKLIEFFEDNHIELYDLTNDPSETRNLATQESERARQLYAMLQTWQKEVTAKFPQPNPDYERLRPRIPNNAHE
ncbi:MAG: sulfatase [Phycisphaerales bacterium]|nr:sulfatase [Phycisphaerales bacterium]